MAKKGQGNHTVNILTPKKKSEFLEHFKNTGNVTISARAVDISRQAVYVWINNDPKFADDFENAKDEALDIMEAECRRRAEQGCLKPVFHQGQVCGEIREYSDTLMIFFLKGNRPEKYKDRVEQENKGAVEITLRDLRAEKDKN
jgi:hypothetical protein